MARANSLKKAVENILDTTEKGIKVKTLHGKMSDFLFSFFQ